MGYNIKIEVSLDDSVAWECREASDQWMSLVYGSKEEEQVFKLNRRILVWK